MPPVSLKHLVEVHDTPASRRFDYFIQFLIIVSLVSFSLETLPDLTPQVHEWLQIIEIVTVAVFTVEYLALGIDSRAVRGLRLLRIFRLLKLMRYQRALNRFAYAMKDATEELVVFLAAALIVLYLAAIGIYACEHEAQPEAFSSVFDGLWWAVATFTTVGYGDVYPVTAGGRIFTGAVLLIGLGIIAVPTGSFPPRSAR